MDGRRTILTLALGALLGGCLAPGGSGELDTRHEARFSTHVRRHWIEPQYCGNRLADWSLVDGPGPARRAVRRRRLRDRPASVGHAPSVRRLT